MAKIISTEQIVKNIRTVTLDRQRIFRVKISFQNIDKTTEAYESHKYISVNGRNYRLFDGQNHILPEEVVEALKDSVGYKTQPKNKKQAVEGLNYDDPDDIYAKIKYENFDITILEDVTPNDLREKLGMKLKESTPITDEEEEAAYNRAAKREMPTVKTVIEPENEESEEDDEDLEEDVGNIDMDI